MKGIYQHCEKQHLHRYLAEFDSRYNNRTAWKWTISSAPFGPWLASPESG